MKSWLAQGSLGRRVTPLPGTTFLHINGALDRHVNSRRTTTRVASTMESANPVN